MNVGFFLCKHLPPHLLLLAFIPPQQHKTLHEQQKRRINCSGSVSNFGFLRCPFLCLTTRGRDPPVLICAEGRDRGKKIGMSWITPSALFVHVQYTYALLLAGGHDPPVLIGWVCSHQHPLYRHTRHSKPHKPQQAHKTHKAQQATQGTASCRTQWGTIHSTPSQRTLAHSFVLACKRTHLWVCSHQHPLCTRTRHSSCCTQWMTIHSRSL